MLKERIEKLAEQYHSEFIDIRRHLHAHPELSYQEFETSKFIQDKLKAFGIRYQGMAETGVIGLIEGKSPGSRVIALRADMDALPILEANQVPYVSQNSGIMHGCGHDVHTTCLLGAARILQQTRQEWEGTVKLIFQPGEERNPGGASLLISEGVLDTPAVQGIIGLHVHPGLEAGKVSFRSGRVMASADELFFTIKSEGGHAAAPHLTADTILIASELIVSLQQLISRNCDPFSPSVLSICSFQGGHTTNVIPSEVQLKGTFRAMDETWRYKAHELIRKLATGLVTSMGATVDVHIDIGYPSVNNQEALTATCSKLAQQLIGKDQVEETELRMGAEDFGHYTQRVPGCFYRLGVRNEAKGIVHNVHTPHFDADESAIKTGMAMMAWLGSQATVG